MDFKNESDKEKLKIIINVFAMVFFLIVVIFSFLYFRNERKEILQNGIVTSCTIIDTQWSRRGTKFKYKFYVNDKEFHGGSSTYNDIEVGEVYELRYISNNPAENIIDLTKRIRNQDNASD